MNKVHRALKLSSTDNVKELFLTIQLNVMN